MSETVEIRLLGFPVGLYVRYRDYFTELMREFALIALRVPHSPDLQDTPARLLELVDELRATYANVPQSANEQRERAIQDAVPPYVVAHDAALRSLAEYRPLDSAALLEVPGFGPTRVERYGNEIVAVIAGFDDGGEPDD